MTARNEGPHGEHFYLRIGGAFTHYVVRCKCAKRFRAARLTDARREHADHKTEATASLTNKES